VSSSPALARFTAFQEFSETDHGGPLSFAVVIPLAVDGAVLVFNRWRKVWELPGGLIDAGDTARDTARRELFEEAGCEAVELEWLGVVTVDDGRPHRGAVFRCRVETVPETMRNDEIDGLARWRAGEAPHPLGDSDRALLEKFAGAVPRRAP
jgi:8-oxo-dGTP diphosphatase